MKYQKKPVVIEAFQMTRERRTNNSEWPGWLCHAWNFDRNVAGAVYPTVEGTGDGTLSIRTLEGEHLVSWDDFIIQGVKGELYPCKPDIFETTYQILPKTGSIKSGIELISEERQRQISGEGWTAEHDDDHVHAEMNNAARAYAYIAAFQSRGGKHINRNVFPVEWMWSMEWWKPSEDPIRNLTKAGALIAAEIDRLQRLKA